MGGWDSYGVWDGHVHTAMFKMQNQQEPTVQHKNSCLRSFDSLDGKGEFGGEWIHEYVWLSHSATQPY